MDYEGPTPNDLDNVTALNQSFLMAVSDSSADDFRAVATHKMSLTERTRLASAPFLLFSFRERDNDYWQRLLDEDSQFDLIEMSDRPEKRVRQLQAAGLGFLWQLARRNPYAVRLVCGASVDWCEQLARRTLVSLLQRAAHRGDLLQLRFADNDNVWRRLIGNGMAASYSLRRASHHGALQVMLTRRHTPEIKRLSAAACVMRGPGRAAPQLRGGDIRKPKV